MSIKTSKTTPPALLTRLLQSAGSELILVGGQALGIWVQHFDLVLPADTPAISNDTDFLASSAAEREPVEVFARVLGGKAFFASKRALTALVGQAVLDVSDDEFIHVDVVHQIVGLTPEAVRAKAVRMELTGGASVMVMHPLHVLRSRLANLYSLREKQNDKGCMQLALAIDVARAFLRAEAAGSSAAALASGRSPIQRWVSELERLATEDAGRKVAKRFGLHVADAIDPMLIPAGSFWTRRWPGLRGLMSVSYANGINVPKPHRR